MHSGLKYHHLFSLLLLLPLFVQAENPTDYQYLTKKYSDAKAVFLKRSKKIYITYDKTGKIDIEVKNHIEKIILKDDAQAYANVSINYNSFKSVSDIEATLYNPDGKSYKKIKIGTDAIKESADFNNGVLYSDNKNKEINFPKVSRYSKIVVNYTEHILDPHFLTDFIFQNYIPAANESFTINFPASMKINYRIPNNKDSVVKFSQSKNRNGNIYTFTASKVKSYDIEDNAPNLIYYVPHVIVFIDSYQKAGKTITLLNNVSGLYHWYYSLVENVNKNPSPELKQITDSITKNLTDTDQIIKAIFYWVQSHIKYVGFEAGMGGFVPRSGSLVCKRRYGDCKDMASLIYAMLKYKSINAHITWIGTRDIPYTYEEVPAPWVDNHMITTVERNGKTIFLDATNKYIPYGLQSESIQGKEALVSIDKNHYKLVKVPIIPAKENYRTDSINVKMSNNDITGKGKLSFGGSARVDAAYNIAYTDGKEHDVVEALTTKGSNKFSLQHYQISDIDNRNKPININYDFSIPDYAKKVNNTIYLNLNFSKDLPISNIDTSKRKYDYQYDYKHVNKRIVNFSIPKGYSVSYLPKDNSYNSPDFSYEIQYKQHNNTITLDKQIIVKKLLIKKKDFEASNEMVKKLSSAYRQNVVLKPIETSMR